jgi:peptidase M23-like protein
LTTAIERATLLGLLLILKTLLCRVGLLVAVLLLAWAPAAYAWSWPVQGPVVQPFAYDESHAYASGQHRGIDIGADAAGEQVVAPASGTVSFAGWVPTSGECVSIQTPGGYTVTLTHLGTILVGKGASLTEGQAVGTIGPSGTPELEGPYVHLGIRTTSDPDGYLDPLSLLPPPAAQNTPAQSQPAVAQPSSSTASSSAPADPAAAATVAPSEPPVATTIGSTVTAQESRSSRHERSQAEEPRPDTGTQPSSQLPASRRATSRHRVHPVQRRVRGRTSTARRPVVEATAPTRPVGLVDGHEIRSSTHVIEPRVRPLGVPSPLPLVLNGAAALVALGAVLIARRRRSTTASVHVLHLPRPGHMRRAA